MSEFVKEVILPSFGLLYDPSLGISETAKIRNITSKEESIIFGSTDDAFAVVVKKCILEPANLDVGNLLSPDLMAILLELRMLTYGTDYKIYFICNQCRKKSQDFVVDLMSFDFKTLDDSFTEPFSVLLPSSKDTLGVRLLREKDFREIDRWAKRLEKNSPELVGDARYTLRTVKSIVSINGEDVPDREKVRKYVESMHGRDSAYLRNKINSVDFGYDFTVIKTCSHCGSENEFVMPITAEFFRPTI